MVRGWGEGDKGEELGSLHWRLQNNLFCSSVGIKVCRSQGNNAVISEFHLHVHIAVQSEAVELVHAQLNIFF